MSKKKAETTPDTSLKKRQREILLGGFLIVISLLLGLSFVSFYFSWQADQSTLEAFTDPKVSSQNLFNKLGALISHFFIYQLFGVGAFVLVYLVLRTGLSYFFNTPKNEIRILNNPPIRVPFTTKLALFELPIPCPASSTDAQAKPSGY